MTQNNSNLKNNEEHIRISENDRRKHKAGRLTYLKRYLCEFCEMSSIQGLSYIVKDISLFERLWWILVLILSISGSFYMVCEIFDNLKTKPVLVSLATKEMSISDIPFPSVTICPESKISRNCLNYSKILKMRNSGKILDVEVEESLYFDLMALLCKTANHEGTISLINKSFAKMREKYPEYFDPELKSSAEVPEFSVDDYSRFLYQCSAIDLKKAECYWIKQKVPCEKVMTSIVTDEGLCYSFNIYDPRDIYTDLNTMEYFEEGRREIDWTPYDGYRTHTSIEDMYPRRAFLNGIQNSFTAVFYSDKRDVNYACRDFSTQGIRVSLHTPTRIPRLSQVFFSVGLNKLTTAAVIPTLTKTSKRIKHYHPEKRNCYFNSERKLKHFKFYSQSSCHFECWTNYTKSHCGCVSFYMPRDNETRVCNMENRFCLQDAELSYTEDLWRSE
ncbi:hypothetical protein HHI36_015349 [Cryptolaemus montrouzieri]|uniref:Uncharacterized protein n=1 Tax=Cryptolaemus montrouzieri TaxID=559131 RepID=A0ABD2N5N2_9CUCU